MENRRSESIDIKSAKEVLTEGGVIDLESGNLTYSQAKAIRQQVQGDCEQLRNRVRMLQMEKERAQKKIVETRKKTAEIRNTKAQNDYHHLNMERLKQQRAYENGPNPEKIQARMRVNDEIQLNKFKIYEKKKNDCNMYRKEKQAIR